MIFELEIIRWLQSFRTDFLDWLFQSFTIFGEEVILICILGFIYWCYDKKIGEMLGLTVFISLGVNSLLKLIVMRPRPFMADGTIANIRPDTAGGYSFPSGHTQTASTIYFSLYYFIKKRWLLIVAIVITTLVALSRMYLGVHYLTDVLTGAALGILISFIFSKLLQKNVNLKKIYYALLVLVVLSFIGITTYNYIQNLSNSVIDAHQFYFDTEDIAKMLGILTGFIIAIFYEKKYVNFENHTDWKKNIIRFVIGLAIILFIRYALKYIFGIIVDEETLTFGQGFQGILAILFDYIRYLAMLFVGIGLYPKLFKRLKI